MLLVRAPQAFLGVVGFPGGGIELGESPLDALRREFTEETGLEVEPIRVLWATTGLHRAKLRPAQQLIAIHWEVRQVGGTFRPHGNGDDVEAAFFCPLAATFGRKASAIFTGPTTFTACTWKYRS